MEYSTPQHLEPYLMLDPTIPLQQPQTNFADQLQKYASIANTRQSIENQQAALPGIQANSQLQQREVAKQAALGKALSANTTLGSDGSVTTDYVKASKDLAQAGFGDAAMDMTGAHLAFANQEIQNATSQQALTKAKGDYANIINQHISAGIDSIPPAQRAAAIPQALAVYKQQYGYAPDLSNFTDKDGNIDNDKTDQFVKTAKAGSLTQQEQATLNSTTAGTAATQAGTQIALVSNNVGGAYADPNSAVSKLAQAQASASGSVPQGTPAMSAQELMHNPGVTAAIPAVANAGVTSGPQRGSAVSDLQDANQKIAALDQIKASVGKLNARYGSGIVALAASKADQLMNDPDYKAAQSLALTVDPSGHVLDFTTGSTPVLTNLANLRTQQMIRRGNAKGVATAPTITGAANAVVPDSGSAPGVPQPAQAPLANAGKVLMVSPSGVKGYVPIANVQAALNQGYKQGQ